MAEPFAIIELDKPRELRFDLRALKALQDVAGVKLSDLGEYFAESDLDVEKLAVLIWAGLRHQDKDLTVDKVMELITWDKLEEISVKIFEIFKNQFGFKDIEDIEKNESRVKNPKNQKNGTGTSPSKLPAK